MNKKLLWQLPLSALAGALLLAGQTAVAQEFQQVLRKGGYRNSGILQRSFALAGGDNNFFQRQAAIA